MKYKITSSVCAEAKQESEKESKQYDAFDAININYRLLCEVFVEDVVSC